MNLRPLGYEPSELPSCSTPRRLHHRCYQTPRVGRSSKAPGQPEDVVASGGSVEALLPVVAAPPPVVVAAPVDVPLTEVPGGTSARYCLTASSIRWVASPIFARSPLAFASSSAWAASCIWLSACWVESVPPDVVGEVECDPVEGRVVTPPDWVDAGGEVPVPAPFPISGAGVTGA